VNATLEIISLPRVITHRCVVVASIVVASVVVASVNARPRGDDEWSSSTNVRSCLHPSPHPSPLHPGSSGGSTRSIDRSHHHPSIPTYRTHHVRSIDKSSSWIFHPL
jgi:hypothetical protein